MMADPAPVHVDVLTWLEQLYGTADEGWLSLFSYDRTNSNKHTDWAHVDDLPSVVAAAATREPRSCIWLGAATRATKLPNGARGGIDDCTAIPGLWLDVDVEGPGHLAEHRLAKDRAHAHRLVDAFPLKPTAVIESGGGLQAWWLFAEMAELDDRTLEQITAWGATWARLGVEHGIDVDNVFEAARVMRLPGTTNRKAGLARPVEVIAADWSRRYGLDDIDQHLDAIPKQSQTARTGVPYIGPERPGDAFSARHTGSEMLQRAGFTFMKRDRSGDEKWCRPGKNPRDGHSAVVYADDGHTTIYSDTVTNPIPDMATRTPYKPFQLYAFFEHKGNFTTAASALSAIGYGTPSSTNLGDLLGDSLKGGSIPADTPWPEPSPLPEDVQVAPLPSHVFPPWLIDHARSVGGQNQVAEDLPALLGLGALSAVLNGHVRIQATTGWVEGVNVWTCILAEAGGSKSPVAKAMQAAARDYETTTMAWAVSEVARYEQRYALLEKRAKDADDAYLREGDETRAEESLKYAAEARDLKRPPAGEIFAGDITPESLVELLAENNEHGAISDTEGTILSIVAGRYSKATNAEFMLKTWAGDHHDVKRKSGDKFRLHDPHLAVSLTVQPGRWRRVLAIPELVEVGFPERFMVSVAPRSVGARKPDLRRQRLDADAADTYRHEFTTLAKRCASWDGGALLQLDDDAIDTFDAMRNDHEPRMSRSGDLAEHAVFIAKLHASILRTAALLHMAWGHDPQHHINGTIMSMAVDMGAYWLDHYLGPQVDGRTLEDAKRIIDWAAEHEATSTTGAELNRGMRTFRDQGGGERRAAALDLLEQYGWARSEGEWPLSTSKQGARIDVGLHPSIAAGHCGATPGIGATPPPSVVEPPSTSTESDEVAPVAPMPPIANSDSSSSQNVPPNPERTDDTGHWRDPTESSPPVAPFDEDDGSLW